MGIGGNIEMWHPFEQALEGSGIQTITFDAPGVGESTSRFLPRRMGALARTVDGLIGALLATRGSTYSASRSVARSRSSWHASPRIASAGSCSPPRLPACVVLGGVPGRPSAMLALATPLRYYSTALLPQGGADVYGGRIRREPELMAEQAHARD